LTERSIQRIFDVVIAGIGLILLFPVGLLIALSLKLSDFGPVFYRQARVGQFGRPFHIWKFRSMVVDADKLGVLLTQAEDPRITRIGRLLRTTKLDQLPQLWNVLIGDMSFVGPRPELPRYVALYTPEQREILKYKPGITDVASLLFRNEEMLLQGTADMEGFYLRHCLPKKIELNLEYAQRATVLEDVWIILQTLCPYWLGVLVLYALALVFSFWLSYQLHSDFRASRQDYDEFRHYLPRIVLPQLMMLVWRGQLRGLMSYFSIPEMRRTVMLLAIALVVQVALCMPAQNRKPPTPSILLMDFILSFFSICAVRMTFRLQREWIARSHQKSQVSVRRVAIIGTGELATNLVLDFARGENRTREVVAFFDDDPRTWHKRPHNIPVIGMPECLLAKEWLTKIDEVIVTLPEAKTERLSEIKQMLKRLPLKVILATGWPVLKTLEEEHEIRSKNS